jgi:hypothetical protein
MEIPKDATGTQHAGAGHTAHVIQISKQISKINPFILKGHKIDFLILSEV